MANLARFNVLDNTLDDMLRGFFVRPMNFEPTATPAQLRDLKRRGRKLVDTGDLREALSLSLKP